MSPKTRRWAASIFFVCASARADGADAERLFREGRAAMLDGHFEEACAKLAESQHLDPRAGTLLNLAACHERQGKIATAWVEYGQARDLAEQVKQPERMRFAEERVAVLAPRVSWLRVDATDDIRVSLDGNSLPKRNEEFPIDAGAHVVNTDRIEIQEGEHRVVSLIPPPPAPPPEPSSPPAFAPPEPRKVEVKTSGPVTQVSRSSDHLVFEPGFFGAYIQARGGGDQVMSAHENVGLVEVATGRHSTCGETPGCSFGDFEIPPTGTLGFQFFGGYSWADRVAAGLRLLVGPEFTGGLLFVVGPEISFRPISRLSIGAFLALGSWTYGGQTNFDAPPGFARFGDDERIEQRHGSAGGGISLGFRIIEFERGDLLVTATPLFMGGGGASVLAVPVGLAYRFR